MGRPHGDVAGMAAEPIKWSRDGKISYQRPSGTFIVDPTNGAITQVSTSTGGAAWSPSTERLAVAAPDGVHIYTGDGRELRLLPASGALGVSWSDDGRFVAVAVADGIVVLGVDTAQRWGAKTATVASMAWAPGESLLVAVAAGVDGDNAGDLIVLHPDGSVVKVGRYHNGLCCAARFDW